MHSQHHSVLEAAVRILEGIRGEELENRINLDDDRRLAEERGFSKEKKSYIHPRRHIHPCETLEIGRELTFHATRKTTYWY